ncbi:MAG TPA: hypothetical protein VFI80_08065 [Burkholderiales bacterium]|nr:hypothetical protein [Burkholderiales bacterium]
MGDHARRSGRHELADLRRAFAHGPVTAPRPEICPSPETLWSAFHGELSPAEVRQIVDHTAVCPACAEDWRLALQMESAADEDEEEEPAPAPTPARDSYFGRLRAVVVAPLAALAATILIAIGAQWGIWQSALVTRGAHDAGISMVSRPALPRNNFRLCWSPLPTAVSYDLTVDTPEPIDITGLKASCYSVPPSALEGLPAESELRWRVEAFLSTGRRVSSITFRSRLR